MTWQPTKADINLGAIRHNYRTVSERIPPGQKALCVVKSNAYGHGLVPVAKTLAEAGTEFFGVATVAEGIALREAGIKAPILLLLGIIEAAWSEVITYDLIPVITRIDIARAFHNHLTQQRKTHSIHVKVDTGMSRLGIPCDQAPAFFDELKKLPSLKVSGVLSHLADATDLDYTAFQKKHFDQLRETLTGAGWKIPLWHLGNSTCAVRSLFPELDMVRIGIVLYGSYPDPALTSEIALQPALTWTTHLLETKGLPAGRPVSYGCTFVTRRPTRIGILPVGYADGYPRLLSNRGEVLIRGRRASLIGRICMDLSIVDITDIPDAKEGDRVTLIGADGRERLTAEQVATWAETISYEIFTHIATRVPHYYQD